MVTLKELTCSICKRQIDLKPKQGKKESKAVHDHYQECLAKMLEQQGYKVIIVEKGGMPSAEGWAAHDIFLLRGLKLEKIVEVVCGDSYEDDEKPNDPRLVINKRRTTAIYQF
jgi:hypothetical protein